jgi:hypothetical protein
MNAEPPIALEVSPHEHGACCVAAAKAASVTGRIRRTPSRVNSAHKLPIDMVWRPAVLPVQIVRARTLSDRSDPG